jgi:branched-chain amino acid transport system substrate-binding protein
MRRRTVRSWKLAIPLGVLLAIGAAIVATTATASRSAGVIKIGIMTDCKGAFGGAYEEDIAGAQAAFAKYAGARPKDPKKPSAGLVGGSMGGKSIKIVGYGCGDETPSLALKETRRLVEQLGADVLIGPLSGDEGVAIANYAKTKQPGKTFINGTSGGQQTTLKVRAPNFFRYNGDGAQWNAGTGEIAYKRLHWRKAAIFMDDYSFGYTSGAGFIADFCSWGGQITKRVFAPSPNQDYSSYVQQLPPPDKVDGYFWVIGGSGTGPSLKAYTQLYGKVDPKKFIGNLFFAFEGNDAEIGPQVVGAYMGGFGTGPGLKTPAANAYRAASNHWYKPYMDGAKLSVDDGFYYNYWNAAWALVKGMNAANGNLSGGQKKLQAAMPRVLNAGFGKIVLDKNRQAIQDQYPIQYTKLPDGKISFDVIGVVRQVTQKFGGYFSETTPSPSRAAPTCHKANLPWHNKIVPVVNGVPKG